MIIAAAATENSVSPSNDETTVNTTTPKDPESSIRALQLTHVCLMQNSANYTTWHYRRQILQNLFGITIIDDNITTASSSSSSSSLSLWSLPLPLWTNFSTRLRHDFDDHDIELQRRYYDQSSISLRTKQVVGEDEMIVAVSSLFGCYLSETAVN
jgi:hypothetical protein